MTHCKRELFDELVKLIGDLESETTGPEGFVPFVERKFFVMPWNSSRVRSAREKIPAALARLRELAGLLSAELEAPAVVRDGSVYPINEGESLREYAARVGLPEDSLLTVRSVPVGFPAEIDEAAESALDVIARGDRTASGAPAISREDASVFGAHMGRAWDRAYGTDTRATSLGWSDDLPEQLAPPQAAPPPPPPEQLPPAEVPAPEQLAPPPPPPLPEYDPATPEQTRAGWAKSAGHHAWVFNPTVGRWEELYQVSGDDDWRVAPQSTVVDLSTGVRGTTQSGRVEWAELYTQRKLPRSRVEIPTAPGGYTLAELEAFTDEKLSAHRAEVEAWLKAHAGAASKSEQSFARAAQARIAQATAMRADKPKAAPKVEAVATKIGGDVDLIDFGELTRSNDGAWEGRISEVPSDTTERGAYVATRRIVLDVSLLPNPKSRTKLVEKRPTNGLPESTDLPTDKVRAFVEAAATAPGFAIQTTPDEMPEPIAFRADQTRYVLFAAVGDPMRRVMVAADLFVLVRGFLPGKARELSWTAVTVQRARGPWRGIVGRLVSDPSHVAAVITASDVTLDRGAMESLIAQRMAGEFKPATR